MEIKNISKIELRITYFHVLLSRVVRTKITWKRYFLSCHVCDPPLKIVSVKILMLTDLIIESAIGEGGEKRSSLEKSRNS